MTWLDKILASTETKTLIFVSTKRNADDITSFLRHEGVNALAIHGDKSQNERDWVMKEFKESRCPVMVATDVAARGLGE
jgi:ATP-dependent RNA helicase DDX5/DBP2